MTISMSSPRPVIFIFIVIIVASLSSSPPSSFLSSILPTSSPPRHFVAHFTPHFAAPRNLPRTHSTQLNVLVFHTFTAPISASIISPLNTSHKHALSSPPHLLTTKPSSLTIRLFDTPKFEPTNQPDNHPTTY